MSEQPGLGSRTARGAMAGLISTLPMTLVMQAVHDRLPWNERYPLEPRRITERITRRLGLRGAVDERSQRAMAIGSHLAFGAVAGALYGASMRSPAPRAVPPVVQGAAFGLMVWAGSYLGWLPATGLLEPATRQPRRRNGLLIASHLVWGAFTGLVTERSTALVGGRKS